MPVDLLTSRAVIGEFYRKLEQDEGASWVPLVSAYFLSDQDEENYAWLGQSPVMREWIDGRHAAGLLEQDFKLLNKHFEGTLEFWVKEMRRDKSGQVLVRIRELATRANAHWAKLLSANIDAGESTTCYDGQFFFDTDHSEGDSGTQDNDLSIDISALPVTNHGTTTSPSSGELEQVINLLMQQILGFKDDQGEPMNENASEFLIMVPITFWHAAQAAVSAPLIDSTRTNTIVTMDGVTVRLAANPRLTWTEKLAAFRSDGDVKALVRQEEQELKIKVKAEGSEFEFDYDKHQYGVDTWRNTTYGYWQYACLATLT
jgi:phage major head subunit gpT-like protein